MHAPLGDARARPLEQHGGMAHTTPTDARIDVLQAAVLAMAATLEPDRAALTRALFLAAVADLERRPTSGEADAAAAGTLAAVLQSLDHAQAVRLPGS